MPTYKITTPEAVQACKAFDEARDALLARGRVFAARYPGSKPIYTYDVHGSSLHGVAFSPVNDSPLWTRPQRDGGDVQRPRKEPAKGIKGDERREQVAALKVLNAEWDAHFPAEKVDRLPVLAALGTDWGSVLLNGMRYFELEGAVYLNTTISLIDGWQEILGSEYEAADAARLAAIKVAA
jgi:hypothetical protein